MSLPELFAMLGQTLEDRRLSRGERQALGSVFREIKTDDDRAELLHHAFALAREERGGAGDGDVLDWLEEVSGLLVRGRDHHTAIAPSEAFFSPGEECPRRIARLFHES